MFHTYSLSVASSVFYNSRFGLVTLVAHGKHCSTGSVRPFPIFQYFHKYKRNVITIITNQNIGKLDKLG